MDALDILDEIASKVGEDLVRRLLISSGDRSMLWAWDRRRAGKLAARLLRERVSRPAIVQRLRARFDFSRRTSYTIIEECLQLCGESRDFARTSGTIEAQTNDHRSESNET